MAATQALLDYASDLVPVVRNQSVVLGDGTTRHLKVPVEITLDELNQLLVVDNAGLKTVRIDQTFDLTALGAAYVNITTVPAGSKIRLAAFQILTTVVDGGTGDSLGIGTHAAFPALMLQGAANLTANYQIGTIVDDVSSIISTSTAIDLCAVVNAGHTLSDGVMTAGRVRVLLVYDTPAILPDV